MPQPSAWQTKTFSTIFWIGRDCQTTAVKQAACSKAAVRRHQTICRPDEFWTTVYDAYDGARGTETATGLRHWLARVWEIRRCAAVYRSDLNCDCQLRVRADIVVVYVNSSTLFAGHKLSKIWTKNYIKIVLKKINNIFSELNKN